MVLIISKDSKSRETIAEMFHYMGVVSECVSTADALKRACPMHHGVLLVGRNILPDPVDYVSRLRSYVGKAPIFAIREDIVDADYSIFDAVYANSVYSSTVVTDMQKLAKERSVKAPGDYRLAGLDACIDIKDVLFLGKNLGLTRTECMIMRYLILSYPKGAGPKDILEHAFRSRRLPDVSCVRTHISSINKKFNELRGHYIICSEKDGYKIMTPELAERKRALAVK